MIAESDLALSRSDYLLLECWGELPAVQLMILWDVTQACSQTIVSISTFIYSLLLKTYSCATELSIANVILQARKSGQARNNRVKMHHSVPQLMGSIKVLRPPHHSGHASTCHLP